ncbi:MAG: hypothetical protein ACYTGZ_22350 [Planctomycetota bacterium]
MSSDYRDLFAAFNARQVEFLVVGAHALAAHGLIRATKDLDVWVRPSAENAPRVFAALAEFGAPMFDLSEEDLCTPGVVFQVGVEPLRIVVLTRITAVEFEEAWATRLESEFEGEPVAVLSRELLIRNKTATGRTQDRADVEWLERNPP